MIYWRIWDRRGGFVATTEGVSVDRFEEERFDDCFSNDLFCLMNETEGGEGL